MSRLEAVTTFPYSFKSLAALGRTLRLRVSSLRCGPLRRAGKTRDEVSIGTPALFARVEVTEQV